MGAKKKRSKQPKKKGKKRKKAKKKQSNPYPKSLVGLKDPLWRKPKRKKGDSKDSVPQAVNVLHAASRINLDDLSGRSWPWRYSPASSSHLQTLADTCEVPFTFARRLLSEEGYHMAIAYCGAGTVCEGPVAGSDPDGAERVLDFLAKSRTSWLMDLVGLRVSSTCSTAPPWSIDHWKQEQASTCRKPIQGKRPTIIDCILSCLEFVDGSAQPHIDGSRVRSIGWSMFSLASFAIDAGTLGVMGTHQSDDYDCEDATIDVRSLQVHSVLKNLLNSDIAGEIFSSDPSRTPLWQAVFRDGQISIQEAIAWLRVRASSMTPETVKALPRWKQVEKLVVGGFGSDNRRSLRRVIPKTTPISRSTPGLQARQVKVLEAIIEEEAFSLDDCVPGIVLKSLVHCSSATALGHQWSRIRKLVSTNLFPKHGNKGGDGRFYAKGPIILIE